MPALPCPPVPRRKLGRRLESMRTTARLTLAETAQKSQLSARALERMERGETEVTIPVAETLMAVYGQSPPGLLDLVREAAEPAWWQDYHLDNTNYLAWETCAATVDEVAVRSVPELLQTAPYAHGVVAARLESLSEAHTVRRLVRDELTARWIRQSRFCGREPLRLRAVITEAAIRGAVGSAQVMLTQWEHLLTTNNWMAVTWRLLPADARDGVSLKSGSRLLRFGDPDEPSCLFTDVSGHDARQIVATEAVRRAQDRFDQLSRACLSRSESVAWLRDLIRVTVGPYHLPGWGW
jgi:transcriptional regulator with XRE-family HTH domain